MTDHPDLEALSASLDDEAGPEGAVVAHVEGCAACQARQAELMSVRQAVGQPVPPPPPAVRDRAIANALAAADAWPSPADADAQAEPVSPLAPGRPIGGPPVDPVADGAQFGRPRSATTPSRMRWWLTGSAAAAVLAVVVGTLAVMGGDRQQTGGDTALSAGPADRSAAAPESASPAPVSGVGDLGDVNDIETLRSRVAGAVAAAAAGGQTLGTRLDSPTAPAAAGAPVAREVGTRVCEIEARTARPQLGPVVYAANLRYQGTPAVLLGFGDGGGAQSSVTLLVLAPGEGCRLLAESTTP